jgi:hypothetical protein
MASELGSGGAWSYSSRDLLQRDGRTQDFKGQPTKRPTRMVSGSASDLSSDSSRLAGGLSTKAADQARGFMTNPFMTEASSLAISSNLLGVPMAQVQDTLRDQNSAKAEQEREEADIYPCKSHLSLRQWLLFQSSFIRFEPMYSKKNAVSRMTHREDLALVC